MVPCCRCQYPRTTESLWVTYWLIFVQPSFRWNWETHLIKLISGGNTSYLLGPSNAPEIINDHFCTGADQGLIYWWGLLDKWSCTWDHPEPIFHIQGFCRSIFYSPDLTITDLCLWLHGCPEPSLIASINAKIPALKWLQLGIDSYWSPGVTHDWTLEEAWPFLVCVDVFQALFSQVLILTELTYRCSQVIWSTLSVSTIIIYK